LEDDTKTLRDLIKKHETYSLMAEHETAQRWRLHARLSGRVEGLQRLRKILLDEEKRLQRIWQETEKRLFDRNHPGFYRAEVLRFLAMEGMVCLGHRITLEDMETGEAFEFCV